MLVINAALSSLVNVVVLGLVPLLVYYLYHRIRHRRRFVEVAQRSGLQVGERRYIAYSAVFAALFVIAFALWPPPLEPLLREGSAQRQFAGREMSAATIVAVLLYGVLKTGLSEEFLFRGLIAGSLGRRMPLLWANIMQSLIFVAPHLLVMFVAPELWWLLPVIFGTSLFKGWVRIRSGSIIGPWLIHAAANITTSVMVIVRTAGD